MVDYRIFDFVLPGQMIVCRSCGARLVTGFSWICAAILFLITVLIFILWLYSKPHHHVWILLFIWGFIAPLIQAKSTILTRKKDSGFASPPKTKRQW
jgi:hypothetical protein